MRLIIKSVAVAGLACFLLQLTSYRYRHERGQILGRYLPRCGAELPSAAPRRRSTSKSRLFRVEHGSERFIRAILRCSTAQTGQSNLFDEAAKGIAHFRPEQGVIDLALAASPSM